MTCAAWVAVPGAGWAQATAGQGGVISEQLETVSQADVSAGPSPAERAIADAEPPKDKSREFLIIPIPHSSPSLGFGLTVAAGMFYNPNNSPEPWITGGGGMFTADGKWAVGGGHKMSLAQDRFRVTAFAAYADIDTKFYGIGPDAGDRDRPIELNEKAFSVMLQGQARVAQHIYAGARFQYRDPSYSIERTDPLFPDAEIPAPQFKSKLAVLGPVLSFDRRDSSLNPSTGEMVTSAWMFSLPGLGSDFDFSKFTLAGNIYRPLGPDTVVAGRLSFCGVSDGAPFYDLCLYGASNDLRGYESGRYRDRAYWAAQVELRQHLFWRIGAVAFVGVGESMPTLTSFGEGKFLPAAGIGLRFRPLKKTPINLRIDYAIGRDSSGFYLGIAEAF